jgi:hypothetical protein
MGERKRDVRLCPICGSVDVTWIGRLAILDPHMECKCCGHRGVFIVGDLEFAKKVREEYLVREGKELT